MAKNPAEADIITKVVDVPTAICIGIFMVKSIKGTKKEPPETPTIPEINPVSKTTGIVINRFT